MCHRLFCPAIVLPYNSLLQKLYKQADPPFFTWQVWLGKFLQCIWLPIWPQGHHMSLQVPMQTALIVEPWWVSWSASNLFEKYNAVQTAVPAFWDHSSVWSRVLTGMLEKVVWKLRNHPPAQVKFPDGAKMREFANMVWLRAPLVNNIIGFIDGVSLNAPTNA